jgi:hypothetical protein
MGIACRIGGYERGKHDYAHPCTDWDVCFWLNKLYPVHVKTLEPDETIAMSFAQWRQGIDPVFERAVALSGLTSGTAQRDGRRFGQGQPRFRP